MRRLTRGASDARPRVPAPPKQAVPSPLYDYWRRGVQLDADGTRRWISEDYAFCRAARAAGFDLCLDTTARLTHTGEKSWALSK
jgi:hypothetical protein